MPQFEYCLRFTRHLLQMGFDQADLGELSREVTINYVGGMGGFHFQPTVQAEFYSLIQLEVYGLALRLRQIIEPADH